jgi:Siphovirus Gp157
MNLYKTSELARLESHIDEDGVIDIASFDLAQIALADKQMAVVAHIKNSKLTEDMLDSAIKEWVAKKKAIAARIASLQAYLAANMKEHGITSIKAINGKFEAKLYLDRDESVVIQDGATFPIELCNPPKPPEPSKTLIKAAINAGQAVAGAMIVRNDRLTIR